MKIDMHVHSVYSPDSTMELRKIAKIAAKVKINGIALTDHNTMRGVQKAKRIFRDKGLTLIPGVELRNNKTDYLIYFVEDEKILMIKNIFEIIDYVHESGGIIGIAHPFRNGYVLPDKEVIEKLDTVEIFNAKNLPKYDELAKKLKNEFCKKPTGGSDAHIYPYIGLGYTIFENDSAYQCLIKNRISIGGRYPNKILRMRDRLSAAKYMPTERKRYYISHPHVTINKILKR